MSRGIERLSIQDRKNLKNKIFVQFLLYILFVLIPLNIVQEWFLHPYIVPLNQENNSFFSTFFYYLIEHFILQTYGILALGAIGGVLIFTAPYNRYIMTGVNIKSIRQKIINPLGMVIYFVVIPNFVSLINLSIDFEYIKSLPTLTLIYFFIFKILWQFLICFLSISYFFYINRKMRYTLELYHFSPEERPLYANFKTIFILSIQLLIFIIILLQIFHLLDVNPELYASSKGIQYLFTWGMQLFAIVLLLANTIIFHQNNINYQIKQQIYQDVINLATNGDLNTKHTYYEQNMLGSFISEYNRFIDYLQSDLESVNTAVQNLQASYDILQDNTVKLTSTLSTQEINVTQINITTNTISSTIQYILSDIADQSKMLIQEKETMDDLITGTNNIVGSFQAIIKGYKLSQEANKKAYAAVEKSLEKTALMNQHIEMIHEKIHTAGLETSAIDEVLNVIKNISEQTNLLSMSAAIEAAHGDTSRKGFTLVAEEIRKLAHMSQESVGKISTRLSTITEHISNAYQISKESIDLSASSLSTGEQLKKSISTIQETSHEIDKITQQVAPITEEQQQLITQFNQIIQEIGDLIQTITQQLKNNSSNAVIMSLSFRSMMQNLKNGRSAMYLMENDLDQVYTFEKQLKTILNEFHLKDQKTSLENYHE